MRSTVVFFIALAACFSPTFPEGIPCSAEGECPGDQICASDNRCYDDGVGSDGGVNPSAALAALEVSLGSLSPPFDPTVADYVLDLNLAAETLAVTATAATPAGTTIAINETLVDSGAASDPLALALGSNLIEIVVTASSAESSTYRIAADRGRALAQQAYVKASNTEGSDAFGGGDADLEGGILALSGDTLVVSAPLEDSSATGVNGNQANNAVNNAGAAYVFVRTGGVWAQQAYLKPSTLDANEVFGTALAISGDTIAIGAPLEDSSATGINGNQNDNSASSAGAVYVFFRSGSTWSQQAYIKASNTDAGDSFGAHVSLSGESLAVGASGEDSNATGINGEQNDNTAAGSGAVYVFTRTGGSWSQQAYIKASNADAGDLFGGNPTSSIGGGVALDGDTLAVAATGEASSATGVNNNQGDNSASGAGSVYVFKRSGTSWAQEAYIKASNTDAEDGFGRSLALAGDTIAVGAPGEDSNAVGIDGGQSDNSLTDAGAVYVFVRSGTAWSQQAYVKASNTGGSDEFGQRVALSSGGLAVGAPREDSNATTINGDQTSNTAATAGAVYLFGRQQSVWTQLAYLKASNSNANDNFGIGLAMSETTIIVSAPRESSSATGIDGDEADNSASNAGAVYVFQ